MKFESEKAPKPIGAYPHARKIGKLLFLSGIGPRKRNSNEIPGVELDKDGNVIVEKTDCEPLLPTLKPGEGAAPPAPTVIGKAVAVSVTAFVGAFATKGEAVKLSTVAFLPSL